MNKRKNPPRVLPWLFFVAVASSLPGVARAEAALSSDLEFSLFPRGDLFQPLLADPKQPVFEVNTWWVESRVRDTWLGVTKLAESFALFRWSDPARARGLQLGLSGGVFAQFDLLADSTDLVNADYVGSLPLTWRWQDLSGRLRFSHQSSHLGDEFVLANSLRRINYTFEALEMLVAYDRRGWRGYGGGEIMVRREPETVDPLLLQFGLEYRHPKALAIVGRGQGVLIGIAGLDAKLWQQDDFTPAVSIKAGFEVARADDPFRSDRAFRVLAAFYTGLSPFGQFFAEQVNILAGGLGFQLDL